MIYTPDMYEQARLYFERLLKGNKTVELKEKRPKRTNPQNRYFHLILGLLARETGYTLTEMKTVLKRVICPEEFAYKKELNGSTYLFERSTAELDSKQMTGVVDKLRLFSSEQLGIVLPLPDEDKWLQILENELER